MKKTLQLAVLAVVVGVSTLPAQAATISVASGAVAVSLGNSSCSLREAIANAESDSDTSGGDCTAGSGTDTIVLANGTYVLPDAAVSDGVYGDSGLPAVNSTFTINGNGATIERDTALGAACGGAGSKFRIIYVGLAGNLTLNDLTLQNGCASFGGTGAGGALFNRGTLSLYRATVTNNAALSSGGAIHNDGTLTLTQSSISSNALAVGAGGGIVNRGTMNVVQSTINGNNTPGAGGGVDTGNSANTTFANATVSGNLADGNGGGIFNQGTTTITNATIALNRGQQNAGAPGFGSGIYFNSGSTTLTNSLVAQQVGTNCNSGLTGGNNNLDDDGTCPTATVTATPQIGSLANNGGPTLTHALLTGSPAIDAGNNTVCGSSPVNGVDQRGTSRPQFGGTSTSCDIGAFEYMVATITTAVPALDPKYLAMLVLMLFLAGGMVIRFR